jgi:Outer membrane protein beta-barrel domain
MQSVRLKKYSSLPRSAAKSASSRPYPYFLIVFLMAIVLLPLASHAQDTQAVPAAPEAKERFDIGVGGFYQITNASNGNFLREDTTSSGGGLVSFRQPYRPWLGYEANVGFTKFYEAYNKGQVKLENNVTDFNVAYLLQTPSYYGVQAFFTIGGGVIVFSPISGSVTSTIPAPTNLPSQALPDFVYSLGLNYPIFNHFGVRGQLRGLKYKTPDFHQDSLNTHTLRSTYEPTLSIYYRF